jgi:hypothetical protein
MYCPKCGTIAKTCDSRRSPGRVRRRRRCFHCEYRFTTNELIRPSSDLSESIRKKAEEFFFKGKKEKTVSEVMALKEFVSFGGVLLEIYLKGELVEEKPHSCVLGKSVERRYRISSKTKGKKK